MLKDRSKLASSEVSDSYSALKLVAADSNPQHLTSLSAGAVMSLPRVIG